MLMLDAMKGVKPKKKARLSSIAGGALLLAGLGAAVPAIGPKQEAGTGLVEMLASGKRSKEIRSITESSDAYLTFSRDFDGVAVGNADIIKITPPKTKRDVVLNGAKVGRTSLTVWYADKTSEQFMISVTRDLSTLDAALKSIASTINAEIAPDRDAIVLTGMAPDEAAAKRAVEAAKSYVMAGKGEGANQGQVISMLSLQRPIETLESRMQFELERLGIKGASVRRIPQGVSPNDKSDVFILEGEAASVTAAGAAAQVVASLVPPQQPGPQRQRGPVVNLIKAGGASISIATVVQAALLQQPGLLNVKVRSVVGLEQDGAGDIVVLEGTVPTQIHLTRALTLAAKVFQQQEIARQIREGRKIRTSRWNPLNPLQLEVTETDPKLDAGSDDIKVVADESGALRKSGSRALGSGGNAVGSVLGASGGSGSGASNVQRLLENQIDTNIARAKALEMADGRVISFITVEDIPEVRIDVKLYEINRTALLTWNSDTKLKFGDSNLHPGIPGRFVQQTDPTTGNVTFVPDPNNPGTQALDGVDFTNILSFLGGGLSNSLSVQSERVDVDALLKLLEKEGIARSLSSPQLTVLSGEFAFFGVGGTVPIQNSVVTQFGGTGGNTQAGGVSGILNQTVERDFGIRLSVRPLVEEDGMITLDLVPSVSQPDSDLTRQIRESTGQSLATTAFQERSLRTSARMRDGATLLIGGLTSRARTDNTNQTPFLHKIPILGALFKGYSYGDDDRELVIVVNPVIVREAPKEAPLWAFPDTSEMTQPAKPASAKQ